MGEPQEPRHGEWQPSDETPISGDPVLTHLATHICSLEDEPYIHIRVKTATPPVLCARITR